MSQKTYSIATLRENLSEVLWRVHHTGDVVDVVYYRRPYASLVSEKKGKLIRYMESPADRDSLDKLKELIEKKSESGGPVSSGDLIEKLMSYEEDHFTPHGVTSKSW